ncbi:mitochondrial proton/calcium exchanger protein-like isoform X2 [Dreissena polymorpha]|uniref:mitochondrial proton/calcium exchanger protein-like isoform X2 n=1 Tax=Dreissena polymorpha TaxID=45954 RepID=UPI002265085E|nr:mitochondrial proton/calcium exchanger protein-like isoform X2 [Dreissena polymorpha]
MASILFLNLKLQQGRVLYNRLPTCCCQHLYHSERKQRILAQDSQRQRTGSQKFFITPVRFSGTIKNEDDYLKTKYLPPPLSITASFKPTSTNPVPISNRYIHSSAFSWKDNARVEKSVQVIKDEVCDLKTKKSLQAINDEVSDLKTTQTVKATPAVVASKEQAALEKPKSFLEKKREKWAALMVEVRKVGFMRYMINETRAFIRHYWEGFQLIWKNMKYCMPLLSRYLREGRSSLKRREYKMLTRTLADLVQMVPLIPMIIIPLGELFIPLYMSLNLMPSVFQKKPKTADYKRSLQVKLEYASLLANSLHDIPLKKTTKGSSVQDFADFMQRVKTSETIPSIDEITKFSSLFEDSITLDDLNVMQLQALCKILGIGFLGKIPNASVLRFQIIMKVRELEVDDKTIQKEGIESLTIEELQSACRSRGMRAVGMSEERLKVQLEQWLDLHIKKRVPTSLLLLTRIMYLDENLSPAQQLKETLKRLPDKTVEKVQVTTAEMVGEVVDTKTKLKVLDEEHQAIKMEKEIEEKEQQLEELQRMEEAKRLREIEGSMDPEELDRKMHERKLKPLHEINNTNKKDKEGEIIQELALSQMQQRVINQELANRLVEQQAATSRLAEQVRAMEVKPEAAMVDKAPTLGDRPAEGVFVFNVKDLNAEDNITAKDLGDIEKAIEDMAKHHKDELSEVKEDLQEYHEDISNVKALTQNTDYEKLINETTGAKKLNNYLNSYLRRLDKNILKVQAEKDQLQQKIELEESKLQQDAAGKQERLKAIEIKKGNLISTNEVLLSLKRLQTVPDDVRMQKVLQVLDTDEDGLIDITDVLKATELISQENLKLNKKQMADVMTLLKKEAQMEMEQKQLEKLEKKGEELKEHVEAGPEKIDIKA